MGFRNPEAIFARYFEEATPTETVSPVFSKISSLIFFAVSVGFPKSRSVPVKSKMLRQLKFALSLVSNCKKCSSLLLTFLDNDAFFLLNKFLVDKVDML